jgi:hypothetical protein
MLKLTEQVRIRFGFAQLGVPFNPTTVTVQVKLPSGANTTYGPGGVVVNDAVGSYYYDFTATELGSAIVIGLGVDASGNVIVVPEVVEVIDATGLPPRMLTSDELDMCVGAQKVDELFDDDADMLRDPVTVMRYLRRAEDYALSKMLQAWSEDSAVLVMKNDSILRMHMAWVALEFASERRPAFLAADGKGQFWAQFTRAEAYFDAISKAALSSTAEKMAGKNAQSGGAVQPVRPANVSRFVFAPDKGSPTGHGGF